MSSGLKIRQQKGIQQETETSTFTSYDNWGYNNVLTQKKEQWYFQSESLTLLPKLCSKIMTFILKFFFKPFCSPFCNVKGAFSLLRSFPQSVSAFPIQGFILPRHLSASGPEYLSILIDLSLQFIVPGQAAAPPQIPTAFEALPASTNSCLEHKGDWARAQASSFPHLSPAFPMAHAILQKVFLAPYIT